MSFSHFNWITTRCDRRISKTCNLSIYYFKVSNKEVFDSIATFDLHRCSIHKSSTTEKVHGNSRWKIYWNLLCNVQCASSYEYIETHSTFFHRFFAREIKVSKWGFFPPQLKAIFLLCTAAHNLIANHPGERNNWYQLSFVNLRPALECMYVKRFAKAFICFNFISIAHVNYK